MDFDHELIHREQPVTAEREPVFDGPYSTWEAEAKALRKRMAELERALAMERGTMPKDRVVAGADDA